MDKDKRKKILWAIAIIILLLAFLFWVLRTSDKNNSINENTNDIPVPVFKAPSANVQYQPVEVAKESPTEFSAINLAKSYTARYGSWSTDNQGANLVELLPLSTSRMKDYLNNIELNFAVEEFSGITTKSLSAKIVAINDTNAEILVKTQKIKTNANLEKEVYYQE